MPSHQAVLPDTLQNPALPIRIVNPVTISGAVAVTLFFATEAVAGAFAMVWALSGLMHLAPALTLTLYALALPGAFATTAKVAMLAWAAETDPVKNLTAGHVQPATAGFDASKDSHHAD